MSTLELVYGLGIAGAVLALLRNILITLRLKVEVKPLNAQVVKLVAAGNVDRALKLCEAVPNALYTRGLIPALKVYVADGSRQEVIQAFEQGTATLKPMLLIGRVVTVVAGLLAGAGLVIAILNTDSLDASSFGPPLVGLFFAVGGEFLIKRLNEDVHVSFGKLLEALREAKR